MPSDDRHVEPPPPPALAHRAVLRSSTPPRRGMLPAVRDQAPGPVGGRSDRYREKRTASPQPSAGPGEHGCDPAQDLLLMARRILTVDADSGTKKGLARRPCGPVHRVTLSSQRC